MYLDLINEALNEFCGEWNNHPLTTQTNFSPQQMWVRGMVMLCNSSFTAVQDVIDPSNYGVDEDGPVPGQEDYRISVPQSPISLSTDQLQHLRSVILASRNDSENGITSYLLALDIVNSFLPWRLTTPQSKSCFIKIWRTDWPCGINLFVQYDQNFETLGFVIIMHVLEQAPVCVILMPIALNMQNSLM